MNRRIIWLTPFILIALLLLWFWRMDQSISSRLSRGWFLPPIDFYTGEQKLRIDSAAPLSRITNAAKRLSWRAREPKQELFPGDYKVMNESLCREMLPDINWPFAFDSCWGLNVDGQSQWAAVEKDHLVAAFSAAGQPIAELTLPGYRFAQYYQGEPILRTVVDLGEIPLYCSQAVTAIEDADFLEHRGISPTGILRALVRNILQARFAEGASTITQQLIKNYFLTSEKTIQRKLQEQIMALLLELRFSKDQILGNYLNLIYMGQQGSFQIRGFAAASEFYFGRSVTELNLEQCSLLAAIINNPGRYNPTKSPERALTRRNLVLNRMRQLEMIDDDQLNSAMSKPLGNKDTKEVFEPAPYFVQTILQSLSTMGIAADEGLKIETTLDPELQNRAQKIVVSHLNELETRLPKLKSLENLAPLQAATISIDPKTGAVISMVGGRSYKINQFNRIHDSRRQPGSLFKPFVVLAALETEDYNADSILQDEPWTHKYEGQTWTPKNYDKKFRGPVTLRQTLAESLNVPTARLGITIGVGNIGELAHRLGIESDLAPLPSLTLGAAETTPWEIAKSYLTIARHGQKEDLHLIQKIRKLNGELLFEWKSQSTEVVQAKYVNQLIDIMKETFVSGTAKAFAKRAAEHSPAGKTGTTSDTKDSWFAGFDESLLTLTWVGFDDNRPTGLTGASAALPIWVDIQWPQSPP